MAERAKLWVYPAFGVVFTLIYSVTSHWIWQSSGWLFGKGMQDFAGSTVVHYQGALAALAGALLLGPRIGKFGRDGRANPIPGHNMPYAVLGTIILWFGWFGFNPGSTLGVVTGDRIGYFGYVALTTNIAAAAGAVGGLASAWWILRKPDISMMLNGVLAALVAITAASGFVAPWAAIVIGRYPAGSPSRASCSSSGSASTIPSAQSPCTGCQASGERLRPASSPCLRWQPTSTPERAGSSTRARSISSASRRSASSP